MTVQNFLSICNEENNLTYKNCLIHNIVRGKYIESGDITKGNGKGGLSIYGETFDEENFTLKHARAGIIDFYSLNCNLCLIYLRRIVDDTC